MKNEKSLRDYTDEELNQFLDANLSTDFYVLGAICSEILRRNKRININKIKSLMDEFFNYGKYENMERIDVLYKEILKELDKIVLY